MNLLDLPVDILFLIFPFLDVNSFVSLTSSCKSLRASEIAEDPAFWSASTRSTFRVPNQPVVQHDGKRWKILYRRLLTQSRIYTWGSNAKAELGHSYYSLDELLRQPPAMRRRLYSAVTNISWPTEMEHYRELGVVADLQAGGWSTTLLTPKGALYSVGLMSESNRFRTHGVEHTVISRNFTPLRFPPGLPSPSEHYDPATAIGQFSAGRAHVLGLSDSGSIWSWDNISEAAWHVKFMGIDLVERGNSAGKSKVKKVVAGWNKSAALVVGVGIVIWSPLSRQGGEDEFEDTALVLEFAIVPDTSYQRRVRSSRGLSAPHGGSGEAIGEVLNFVVLEDYVLFNTDNGQVYAAKINWDDQAQSVDAAFIIPIPTDEVSSDGPKPSTQPVATDVQGSYLNFAIFTNTGAVLTGNQDYLSHLSQSPSDIPADSRLVRIPALQNTHVIALAFGDHHFHALHSNGSITSYGTEPRACGCLGLGGSGNTPEGRLRGVRYAGLGGDGKLVSHALAHGRQVWFEEEKRDWIRFLVSGGADPEEARERLRMCGEVAVQGEVSEWIEQEGRAWEERFGKRIGLAVDAEGDEGMEDDGGSLGRGGEDQDHDIDNDGDDLPAYFALSITAGGWHSGALVLVNDAKAARIRENCLVRTRPPHSSASSATDQPQTRLAAAVSWTLATARQALAASSSYLFSPSEAGRPRDQDHTRTATADTANTDTAPVPPHSPAHFTNPVMHGAARDEHTPYRWAHDAFPRLRLSDGRYMPGTVWFNEWRYGKSGAWVADGT